jgi:hypothetical protein
MRQRIIALFLVALFTISMRASAFLPAAVFDPVAAAKADPLFDEATYKKLTILSLSVNWDHADIQLALDDLSHKSVKADPAKIGITFSLQLQKNTDAIAYHRQVHIIIKDTPIFSVLEYITEQTNLIPLIHKGAVIMVPGRETRLKMSDQPPPSNVR